MTIFKSLLSKRLRQRLVDLRPRLYRMACAWSGNPHQAEDLVQETMERVLKRGGQLKDPGKFESWVFSILSNCFRDACRRGNRTDSVEAQSHGEPHPSAEALLVVSEQQQRVRNAIQRLTEGQREVICLVDLEGFAYAEAAGILNLPIGTVMSRLNRGREQLKRFLVSRDSDSGAKVIPMERVK